MNTSCRFHSPQGRTDGEDPTYVEVMTNKSRPYQVILNGRSHDRGATIGLYERIHTFSNHKAAYGCALDFVLHGPRDNTAHVRLNGRPFLRIERQGAWITTTKVDWSGEG